MVSEVPLRLACFILLFLLAASALEGAKQRTYSLRGKIDPPPGPAVVVLSGVTSPYLARVQAERNGEFRFNKLDQGPYKVWVFSPGHGEVERTVEVGPGTSGRRGRVPVAIPFTSPDIESLARQQKVSVKDLAIPNEAKLCVVEARRLLGRKNYEDAIQQLERAVKIAPEFAAAWNELGTVSYRLKRYTEAEANFRKAMDLDPGRFDPIVNLGGVLLNLNRPQEAFKYNTFAIGQRPKEPLANAQMGLNYFMLGNYDAALSLLKEAKARDASHFSYPQLYIAEIYLLRGDNSAAIAELQDFLNRHPDAEQAAKVRERVEALKAK
jgi:Tfp pilus assembly protein PilF